MDCDTPFECTNCGRRFGVIWCNDSLDMPVESCPFCGDENLVDHSPQDDES